jgi:mannose-6-phosphate isomerase-like protein (cupin superfamily)
VGRLVYELGNRQWDIFVAPAVLVAENVNQPGVDHAVEHFRIDAGTGERSGLLVTATVGEGGWVDLPEPIVVKAGEAFVAVPLKSSGLARREERMEKVNLVDKLAVFTDYWKPKIVGELNGQQVNLVKFQGPFVWHHHDNEDELFLVVKGRFRMEFRDRRVWLEEGEFLIVPRGVEHRPVAEQEAHVLLFEPASTLNTGNVRNERTVAHLDRI